MNKSIKQNNTNVRYEAIDGLRAYSAIGVAMMHILMNGQYQVSGFIFDKFITSLGNLVFLFMLVSAFSMCCGYYNKIIKQEISIEYFYSRRYSKILPFFATLCFIDVIISPSKSAIYELFANLTLSFGLLPNANISVIGIGWFLGLIFVFYMIFPFFCYLISNKKRAWFILGITIIYHVLCRIYFFDKNHVLFNYDRRGNIIYSAMFFIVGGIIFLYKEKLSKLAEKYKWILIILCIAVGGMYFYEGNSETFIMLILFGLLLIYAIGNSDNRSVILQNHFTKFMGNISLEIYLSHMVIFRLLQKIGLTNITSNAEISYVVTVLMTLVGAVVFSLMLKKIIEKVQSYR